MLMQIQTSVPSVRILTHSISCSDECKIWCILLWLTTWSHGSESILGNQTFLKLHNNFAPIFGNRNQDPHSVTTSTQYAKASPTLHHYKPSDSPLSHFIAISYTLSPLTSMLLDFLTLQMTALRYFDISETIYPSTHLSQLTGFE
jgi:hypothetical protein